MKELLGRGYDNNLTVGWLQRLPGVLGIMISPSIVMIIYSVS